jgi:tetratricopeptide (TPR) repeat protein
MVIFYDKQIPEGAISLELVDHVYLEQMLEEGGAGDLIPVFDAYLKGQILESLGRYKDASKLYKEALKRRPDNRWMKYLSERTKYILN